MAEGVPAPESGTLVFEAQMQIDKIYEVGKTPYGNRRVAVVRDGMLSGAKLSGFVTPGALDFELKLSNGVTESPYAWLKTGSYLSSNPGPAAGGVGITMYDSTH